MNELETNLSTKYNNSPIPKQDIQHLLISLSESGQIRKEDTLKDVQPMKVPEFIKYVEKLRRTFLYEDCYAFRELSMLRGYESFDESFKELKEKTQEIICREDGDRKELLRRVGDSYSRYKKKRGCNRYVVGVVFFIGIFLYAMREEHPY